VTPNQFAYAASKFRDNLPHGQRPTDAHVRVAWIMARWQDTSPSHARLARAAKVHRNTVANALTRFRELGLLDWKPRYVRLNGGHVARGSNHYFFPEQPSLPVAALRPLRQKGIKQAIFACPTKFVHTETQGLSREELMRRSQARVAAAWASRRV
jgi:DNA-binding transcriptional MocR family regulator